jgi:DNA invertase Pin-like site-specific DNA recombinase
VRAASQADRLAQFLAADEAVLKGIAPQPLRWLPLARKSGTHPDRNRQTGGTKAERPGLERALADVRPGDSLVVWKLDRLGRGLKQLIETVTDLSNRGVGFQSLEEAIATTTGGGKLIFHDFGALAEF